MRWRWRRRKCKVCHHWLCTMIRGESIQGPTSLIARPPWGWMTTVRKYLNKYFWIISDPRVSVLCSLNISSPQASLGCRIQTSMMSHPGNHNDRSPPIHSADSWTETRNTEMCVSTPLITFEDKKTKKPINHSWSTCRHFLKLSEIYATWIHWLKINQSGFWNSVLAECEICTNIVFPVKYASILAKNMVARHL